MQKWEYKAVMILGIQWAQMEPTLNKLGAEGWELVAVAKSIHYFKRLISD